jgi:hypothetical protein
MRGESKDVLCERPLQVGRMTARVIAGKTARQLVLCNSPAYRIGNNERGIDAENAIILCGFSDEREDVLMRLKTCNGVQSHRAPVGANHGKACRLPVPAEVDSDESGQLQRGLISDIREDRAGRGVSAVKKG